jgi:hypothetical protein
MIYIPSDILLATGQLEIIVVDAHGAVKDHRNVKNTVTISGKKYIANRMKTTGIVSEMSHMAIGTGTSGSDDNIQTEPTAAGHRVALTTAGGTVSNNSVTYTATFPGSVIATNVAVTEAGIFNYATYTATPSASQFMLCRTAFAVVNKLVADTLTINWTVTIN